MIVMKFGGASLADAARVRRVASLVGDAAARGPVVTVVSAHAGVTDMLAELVRTAPEGGADAAALVTHHHRLLADLGLPSDLVDPVLAELQDLLRGMGLVGEASPRATDHLLAVGERLSSRICAAAFTAAGTPATALDAGDAGLRTDSSFGAARPQPDRGEIGRRLREVEGVPVVTGFIGRDAQGNTTTLGRNGSDYSAALFGEALGADEIQIWKNVDGVMTADPELVAEARPIPAMSYDEAAELAYYGGKVLHPAAIQPAMQHRIPVRVLHTGKPTAEGTLIVPDYDADQVTVRAVVHKRHVHLVTVVSPRMLAQHGFLAQVFEAASRHRVDVDLVATSEVSISMTVADDRNLGGFLGDLETIGEIHVQSDQAMVCVVGSGIAREQGVAAQMLTTLAETGIRVRCISQGAVKVNIAVVVAGEQVGDAVRALHARFFPAS